MSFKSSGLWTHVLCKCHSSTPANLDTVNEQSTGLRPNDST